MEALDTNSRSDRLARWNTACDLTGRCPHCSPHRGENRAKGKARKSRSTK